MGDFLCKIMGVADILAGILIIVAFSGKYLGIFFGAMMLIKGGFSFL